MDQETIQLGDQSYHVVPQRIGYLRRRFAEFIRSAGKLDADASDVIGVLGDQAHSALRIFIPNLMPEHEFLGYGSAEALEASRRARAEHAEHVARLRADHQAAHPLDDRESPVFEEPVLEDDDPGYDVELDRSPTPPEIIHAFNVCMRVSRFDLLKHLRGLVGEDFLRAWVTKAMADFLA